MGRYKQTGGATPKQDQDAPVAFCSTTMRVSTSAKFLLPYVCVRTRFLLMCGYAPAVRLWVPDVRVQLSFLFFFINIAHFITDLYYWVNKNMFVLFFVTKFITIVVLTTALSGHITVIMLSPATVIFLSVNHTCIEIKIMVIYECHLTL